MLRAAAPPGVRPRVIRRRTGLESGPPCAGLLPPSSPTPLHRCGARAASLRRPTRGVTALSATLATARPCSGSGRGRADCTRTMPNGRSPQGRVGLSHTFHGLRFAPPFHSLRDAQSSIAPRVATTRRPAGARTTRSRSGMVGAGAKRVRNPLRPWRGVAWRAARSARRCWGPGVRDRPAVLRWAGRA